MIKTLLLAIALTISAPVHASSTTNNHSLTPANNVQTIEQALFDQNHASKTMKRFNPKIARR